MRALLMHCKKWRYVITGLANRPLKIRPEKIKDKVQESEDCIVVFFTVEKEDNLKETSIKMTWK